jgi:hypothetical protein
MSRGSFPKGPRNENPLARRERYEQWLIATAGQAKTPDHELSAVAFYRGQTTTAPVSPSSSERKTVPRPPSPGLCIIARCWQCAAGPDESNAQDAIANCRRLKCGLYPVRPYQEQSGRVPRSALRAAIRAECLDCARGNSNEVRLCHSVTCALWPVRTFQPGDTPEPAEGQETGDAA